MSRRKSSSSSLATSSDSLNEVVTPSASGRKRSASRSKVATPAASNVADLVIDELSQSSNDAYVKDNRSSHVQEHVHYEFGGPIGAFGVIVGLPFVIYMLYFLCNDKMCMYNPLSFNWQALFESIKVEHFITKEGVVMYMGWFAFSVLLERVLPGELVEGGVLPTTTNSRLKYIMSGHLQLWVSLAVLLCGVPQFISVPTEFNFITPLPQNWYDAVYQFRGFQALPLEMMYDHYVPMITTSIIFTTLFSLYL
jgi:hypothetical protein